jgi:hypothetical protein
MFNDDNPMILGVHGKSSNLATRCELGTLPIKIKCYNLMFRYYTRFCETNGQPGTIILIAIVLGLFCKKIISFAA